MTDAAGRDDHGRFAAGNAGGPGGSRRRAFVLRRAAEDAITTEHVQAIIRKAARMALEGNLPAMRLVLERTAGRAADAPMDAEPLGIVLPKLQTAGDCNSAIQRIVEAICQGSIERDAAKLLIDAIQVRMKAIELQDIEARLTELEKTATTVQPQQRNQTPTFS